MRNLYLLLALALMCQSCFTYRQVDKHETNLAINKRYKIKLYGGRILRGELKAANDSTLTVFAYNETMEVKRSDIKKMEAMKFSTVKTIGYPIGTVVALVGLFAASYSH